MAGRVEGKGPLEERTFERTNPSTGFVEVVPALDKVWVKVVDFLPYRPPSHLLPPPSDDASISEGAVEQDDPVWVEAMTMLDEDLMWLLQLDQHKFWCQVIHDSSLQKALDTYLCFAQRPHEHPVDCSMETRKLLRSIHRRVFMVFLRMSTHKEGGQSGDSLSVEAFGKIIYDRYLFDIPRILDLCSLYGASNKPLLAKMVENVFEKQPKYAEDWEGMVRGSVMEVFTKMEAGGQEGAVRLDRAGLSVSKFSELVLYLFDFAGTLRSFLNVYSPACFALMSAGFVSRVVSFYESTVTQLQENWRSLKDSLTDPKHIKECLRSLKCNLAWLVHEILHTCFIAPRPQDSSGIRSKSPFPLDLFISNVSDIATEKSFLKEYKKQFDVAADVALVQHAHPEIPETHFDYVLSALMEADDFPAVGVAAAPSSNSAAPSSSSAPPSGATAVEDEGVLQSLVSQVKDLLPHLGEGFIELCLKEFNNNPETVINKVLEESLPPHLQTLNFDLPAGGKTMPPVTEERSSLLDTRKNIFDDDEFDVLRRPEAVDLSRVQIGKKFNPPSVSSVLDDKSHLVATRDRYKEYAVETPWDYASENDAFRLEADDMGVATGGVGVVGAGFDTMYDDEYDDTYDSHNVGAPDDATDEQYTVSRLNQKGLYGKHWVHQEEEEGPSGPQQSSTFTNEKQQAKEFIRNYMKSGQDSHKKEGRTEGRGHGKGGVTGRRGEEIREEEWRASKGRRGEERHALESKEGKWRQDGDRGKGEGRGKPRGEGGWAPKQGRGEERGKPRGEEKARGEGGWAPKQGRGEEREKPRGEERARGEGGWVPKQSRGEEREKPRGEEKARREGEGGWTPKQGREEERGKPSAFGRKNDGGGGGGGGGDGNGDGDHRNGGGHHGDGSGGIWEDGDAVSSSKGEAGTSGRGRTIDATPKVKCDHKDGSKGQPKDGAPSKSSGGKTSHSKSGSVQRSRQLKDRHKGSQANHNRKAMADKKMRGGML